MKLSLAMIAKNEARCLARCLRSVRAIADEIIVTDTGSTDDTVKIASEYGAKVSHFDLDQRFRRRAQFRARAGDRRLDFSSGCRRMGQRNSCKGNQKIHRTARRRLGG